MKRPVPPTIGGLSFKALPKVEKRSYSRPLIGLVSVSKVTYKYLDIGSPIVSWGFEFLLPPFIHGHSLQHLRQLVDSARIQLYTTASATASWRGLCLLSCRHAEWLSNIYSTVTILHEY